MLRRTLARIKQRIHAVGALRFPGAVHLAPEPALTVLDQESVGRLPATDLVIVFPGLTDLFTADDFTGLLNAIDPDARLNLLALDARFGHFTSAAIAERIRKDIVAPARAAGTRRIWLVGASVAGPDTLQLACHLEDSICGVILLAPSLGDPALIDEIGAAGGLARWRPCPERTDPQERIWKWLQERADRPNASLFIGYADKDPFAPACRLISEALPPANSVLVRGRHDWKTWHRAWPRLLARAGIGARALERTTVN